MKLKIDRTKAAKGVGAGTVLTVPAISLAVASGGAGHGDYFWAIFLFPGSSLLIFLLKLKLIGYIFGILQFPIYGLAAGVVDDFDLFGEVSFTVITTIALQHIFLFGLCYVFLSL